LKKVKRRRRQTKTGGVLEGVILLKSGCSSIVSTVVLAAHLVFCWWVVRVVRGMARAL
jgi:hypothetical protein